MSAVFRLPDLGEGIYEGEIIAVLVEPGQQVTEGQPILQIETEKAMVDIPSPYTGIVKEIPVQAGDIVNVGDVLMTFEGVAAEPLVMPPEKEPAVKPAAEKQPAVAPSRGPVPAAPATRRLARELGVDLRTVPPSGPAGLVTADDVRTYAQKKAVPAAEGPPAVPVTPSEIIEPKTFDFARWGAIEREPLRSVRRATAKQMAMAWSQIPHVTSQDIVDITKLEAFRRKHKTEIHDQGGHLTLTVFAMKAAATALKKYPRFNASLDTSSQEIVLKHYYHIGIAVDTEYGLVVPVIRDIDRKSIAELSVELKNMSERARAKQLTLEDTQGGTFTITNLGHIGGTGFTPIINYPEVAILGFGRAQMQPVVQEISDSYTVEPRLMLPIILSFDHRVLDGADAARFIRVIVEAFQDPDELLLMMT